MIKISTGEFEDENEEMIMDEIELWDQNTVINDKFKFDDIKLEDLNKQQVSLFKTIIDNNLDLFANSFEDLKEPCNISDFKITTVNEKPLFQYAYRNSQKENKDMKDELGKMLKNGIIRDSKSPWSSPAIIVGKKDGSKRFCVDYRKLNNVTLQDPFPMPRIADIFDRLRGAEFFTALDLKSGYWQIAMNEESIPKTAFSTSEGHYEFLRMPFGLKNAPAEFSRIMHQVLGNFEFVQIYLDDITIFSKNFNEHLKHIIVVLRAIRNAKLKINPKNVIGLKNH